MVQFVKICICADQERAAKKRQQSEFSGREDIHYWNNSTENNLPEITQLERAGFFDSILFASLMDT
jgi:hypothetical protein